MCVLSLALSFSLCARVIHMIQLRQHIGTNEVYRSLLAAYGSMFMKCDVHLNAGSFCCRNICSSSKINNTSAIFKLFRYYTACDGCEVTGSGSKMCRLSSHFSLIHASIEYIPFSSLNTVFI